MTAIVGVAGCGEPADNGTQDESPVAETDGGLGEDTETGDGGALGEETETDGGLGEDTETDGGVLGEDNETTDGAMDEDNETTDEETV